MERSLHHIRQDYQSPALRKADTADCPFEQFETWFEFATNRVTEPTAAILATASKTGKPAARTVLLKAYGKTGFIFYTNYESQKGRELAENPRASLLFVWLELHRQIRIGGRVEKVAPEVSDAYFAERPEGSRIGAWASAQSNVIESRELLEQAVEKMSARFAKAANISRPPHWGGYRIIPDEFEFWQGQPSRLHDRISYQLQTDGKWIKARLQP